MRYPFHSAPSLALALAAAVALIPTASVPAARAQSSQCTASSVVSSRQGRQRNGELIPANRSNPNVALGDFSDGSFSLGFGGEIILRFDKAILNGPGSDLTVFEGSGTERRLESAQVFASSDGVNFTFIGNALNQGGGTPIPTSLDLGTLTSAQFIKIVDSTPAKLYSDVGDEASADGFDVAAVFGSKCGESVTTPTPTPSPKAQCTDGIDNDGDGRIDSADPGCHTDGKANNPASFDPNDNLEADSTPQCRDGLDNDGDGLIDLADPGCSSADDSSETTEPSPAPSGGNTTIQTQQIIGAGAGDVSFEQRAGGAEQKFSVKSPTAGTPAPAKPASKPAPAVKGAITVTAPRPVPLTVPTGMNLGTLLFSLTGVLSGVGTYLFRKSA